MSERHFQESLGNKENIEQELQDEGLKSPEEWKELYDTADEYWKTVSDEMVLNPRWRENWISKKRRGILKEGVKSFDDLVAFGDSFELSFKEDRIQYFTGWMYNRNLRLYPELSKDEDFSKGRMIEVRKSLVKILADLEIALAEDRSDKADLAENIEKACAECGISEEICFEIKQGMWAYFAGREAVGNILKKYPQPEVLFENFFSAKPKGKIETLRFGVSLIFRCFDPDDFIQACKQNSGGDPERAQVAWGFALGSRYPGGVSTVTLEKVLPEEREQSLWKHENQHHVNKLFPAPEKYFGKERLPIIAKMFQEDPSQETLERLVRSMVQLERISMDIDARAKDEIIAQYSGNNAQLSSILHIMQFNELYNYSSDHSSRIKSLPSLIGRRISTLFSVLDGTALQLEEGLSEGVEPLDEDDQGEYEHDGYNDDSKSLRIATILLEPLVYEVFQGGYRKDLKTWIDSIKMLEKKKYSRDEIVAFLNTEDIHRWATLARRLPVAS